MMYSLDIELENNLNEPLRRLAKGLTPRRLVDEIDAVLYNRIRERYLAQVDPDYIPWIPSEAAMREGRNTLFDTGRLYRSIQLYRLSDGSSLIGTDVEYGRYHNEGEGNQVERKFLGFGEDDEKISIDYLKLYVQKLIDGDVNV